MPTQLKAGTRVARKPHWCGLCNGPIAVGESHHVSTNVYDGRVYDWRTCEGCKQDGVTALVYDWAGGPDDGIGYDSAIEWSDDAHHSKDQAEREAAAAFRVRAGIVAERACPEYVPARTEKSA